MLTSAFKNIICVVLLLSAAVGYLELGVVSPKSKFEYEYGVKGFPIEYMDLVFDRCTLGLFSV